MQSLGRERHQTSHASCTAKLSQAQQGPELVLPPAPLVLCLQCCADFCPLQTSLRDDATTFLRRLLQRSTSSIGFATWSAGTLKASLSYMQKNKAGRCCVPLLRNLLGALHVQQLPLHFLNLRYHANKRQPSAQVLALRQTLNMSLAQVAHDKI